MIRGLHGLFYSSEPEETREFLRDKLRLPYTDVGGGWLIFDLPESDLGVHPVDESGQPPPGTHDVSFYCDDIHGTVADLRARGVRFKQEIADHRYGFVTYFTMPGGVEVQLYEPKYVKASAAPRTSAKRGATAGKRKRSAAGARSKTPIRKARAPRRTR
ncbi:MAG TPA: VOC family protein [Myxococcaceae bacterium]|nr:VOC family protein [Myxococcaceae bacterium]